MISPSQLKIGIACAAYYSEKWLRAEVIAEPDSDQVKLLFIDFGTIGNVSIKNIRWLLSSLCDIPRLCHRGALDLLRPINNYKIERLVTKTFCEMVGEKSVMAVISHINEVRFQKCSGLYGIFNWFITFQCNTISMILVDTNDPHEDVIINKILLDDVLAVTKRK